jgi:hypothetical protein
VVTPLTLQEIADAILPWAEVAHPDKAAQVRAQASHEPTYRRWLGRLIEIRYAEDAAWRGAASLPLLHETGLIIHLQSRDDMTLVVCGRYAPKPWAWTFAELATLTIIEDNDSRRDSFNLLVAAKQELDLVHCAVPIRATLSRVDLDVRRPPLLTTGTDS